MKSAIKNITNSRDIVTIIVLTIKVNLAKPLPLYFSGFFLIFFKLILLKINANVKPTPAVNGERTKEIKLITLRGSWIFF